MNEVPTPDSFDARLASDDAINELANLVADSVNRGVNVVEITPELRSHRVLTVVKEMFEKNGWKVSCGDHRIDSMYPPQWEFRVMRPECSFWQKFKKFFGF